MTLPYDFEIRKGTRKQERRKEGREEGRKENEEGEKRFLKWK